MSEAVATRIAVIYYSATGTVHRLALAVAEGAEEVGAEVRTLQVPELFPEMVISESQHWGKHRSETQDGPEATIEDLAWADGWAFGSPTRFGNIAAQLKMFLDQAGSLWQEGKLANKVGTGFTASQTAHGGQESTILALNNTLYHWGAIVLPLGYTVSEVYNGGGNPYGASFVTEGGIHGGPDEHTLTVARAQGRRLTQVSAAVAAARRQGSLDTGAGVADPLKPAESTGRS
jgi:NAD(P)H dehydrogenase (quinone)